MPDLVARRRSRGAHQVARRSVCGQLDGEALERVDRGRLHYEETDKNNLAREHSLESVTGESGEAFVAKGPTPSETAVGKELWERIQDGQPLHYQRMLQMRRDGAKIVDIAVELGVDQETVRRFLKRFKRDFEA